MKGNVKKKTGFEQIKYHIKILNSLAVKKTFQVISL